MISADSDITAAAGARMTPLHQAFAEIEPMRDANGRYVSRKCPDPNCGGTLRPDGEDIYRCDGLTFDTENGPLCACRVTFDPLYDRVPS